MDHIVIIGAGQGGFQAASSLRQEGYEDRITLIGDEPERPYQRPPLSKSYFATGEEERLYLRNAEFFEQQNIDFHANCRIDGIDTERQKVTSQDQSFSYDHLILATGCQNAQPPIKGLERCHALRTLADARRLRHAAAAAKRCAIIGGGFIGLEFAAAAGNLDLKIAIAEMADRLMARAVSPITSERFLTKHQTMGTVVHLGRFVTEVTEDGLLLSDGTLLPADLVILAAGVVPNTALADKAGLQLENGIAVDDHLLTSNPHISALGDCASFPNPVSGNQIRLESVQAATDHARHIAKRLVRNDIAPYAAVPWFWSDQADWKLQIAGLAMPEDESIALDDSTVLRFANGALSAVETINSAKRHMKARKALAAQTPLSREEAIELLQ